MHLARIPIDMNALSRAIAQRGFGRPRGRFSNDEGKALHHLLTECLGRKGFQPFRLVVAPKARRGMLYGYTSECAVTLRESARGLALSPAHEAAIPLAMLETKPMPDFYEGQRVGFEVRVRPSVRLASDIEPSPKNPASLRNGLKKGSEIDAFLSAITRDPNAAYTREGVYAGWLQKRLDGVADMESTAVSAYLRRTVARGNAGITGPDVTCQGTLRVLDAKAFADRIRRGVGRHTAYGYGMLLLRPTQAA